MTSPGNFKGVLYHETFQGVRCRVLLLGGMTACPVCFEVGSNAEACNSVVLCSKFFHYQSLYFISFTLIYSFPWFLLRCARRTFFSGGYHTLLTVTLKVRHKTVKTCLTGGLRGLRSLFALLFLPLKKCEKKEINNKTFHVLYC